MYKGISMLFVLLLYVFDIFRSVLTNYKMILLLSIQFHGFRKYQSRDNKAAIRKETRADASAGHDAVFHTPVWRNK